VQLPLRHWLKEKVARKELRNNNSILLGILYSLYKGKLHEIADIYPMAGIFMPKQRYRTRFGMNKKCHPKVALIKSKLFY